MSRAGESDLKVMMVRTDEKGPGIPLMLHVTGSRIFTERVGEESGGLRRRIYDFNTEKWIRFSIAFSDVRKIELGHNRYGQGYFWLEHGKGWLKNWVGFRFENDDDFGKMQGLLLSLPSLGGKVHSK